VSLRAFVGSLCVHKPCQGLTSLSLRSQGLTWLPVRSQRYTLAQNPDQDAPINLIPPSQVLCFFLPYILPQTARQRIWNIEYRI